jgi:hypothetical protein
LRALLPQPAESDTGGSDSPLFDPDAQLLAVAPDAPFERRGRTIWHRALTSPDEAAEQFVQSLAALDAHLGELERSTGLAASDAVVGGFSQGGGMALGELCFSTGLASAIGGSITGWIPAGDWSGPVLLAVAALVAAVTSEFTSNTASANMVVPVVIALARATGCDPLMAALSATFASSLGFMMPVSTPCNAIVYGSGRVPLRAMMASGAVIDVAGLITVTAAMLLASRF